ncbi:hypothetical protein WAF17_18305 [Bernardetia sp. ABR2-2B]|uniref:hypothetical protein n=1 Tax=Bernardetia sp. ABR2-2B TaxID=3127472 RepID=UPI0030D3A21F
MKNTPSFYKIMFLTIIFLLPLATLSAQNTDSIELPKAYITNELYVILDGDAPQDAKVFEADITSLNLTTIEDANHFFSFFNDTSVEFETDIAAQKVKVTLIPDTEKENWTLGEWGMYFKNKISTQREQSGTYIDFTKK